MGTGFFKYISIQFIYRAVCAMLILGAWNTQAQAASNAQPAGTVSVQSYGVKGDGVTDDTKALRTAAATRQPLWFPWTSTHYRVSGYIQLFNSAYGENRPEIRMYGSNGNPDQGDTYTIFVVKNYSGAGLVIDGLRLNGGWNSDPKSVPVLDQNSNPPFQAQWAHCIRVNAPAKNVTIQNCWLQNPMGDCVSITWYDPAPVPPDSILIQNCKLQNPWRCTIAFVGGTNITIRNCYHEKRHDKVVAMIDLESDPIPSPRQYNRYITFQNNVLNATRQAFGQAAITCANPINSQCGPVTITGLRGTWVDEEVYAPIPNTAMAGGYYGSWTYGGGFTASDNIKDGKITWNFPASDIHLNGNNFSLLTGDAVIVPKRQGLEVRMSDQMHRGLTLKAFTLDGRTAGSWDLSSQGSHFIDCNPRAFGATPFLFQLTGENASNRRETLAAKKVIMP